MVVVDSFMTATALEADVVLPASLPIETEGTFTACDRRVQATAKIFEPRTGMENWQILEALAEKMHIALTPRARGISARRSGKLFPSMESARQEDSGAGACWRKPL